MSVNELPNKFYIDDFLINIKTGEVIYEEKSQVIEPKVMALLKTLAQNPKRVIAAETLFEIVWPQAIYSPNSVRRNIALLRQALSDDDKRIIKTHPKRGYSLDSEVRFPEKKANALSKKSPLIKYLKLSLLLIPVFILISVFFSLSDTSKQVSLLNLKPITASNEQERYMQISPDGRFMAYIQNTNQPNKRKILIKDLVTGSSWPLKDTLNAYTYLAWDSHKNALVYSCQDEKGISFNRLLLDAQLKVVSEELLFSRSDITWNSLFFIDKRQQLYYLANQNSSEHSRNVSLYRHNLESGQTEKLLKPNDYFKPYKLALSPTQTQLALVGFNKQALSEVKLLNLDSNDVVSIGQIDHNWYFLTWFENNKYLLLSNGSELKQLSLNGDLTTLNYKSYNFLVYPQIIKDKVYFIEAKSDQDILLSKLKQLSPPQKIINSNTIDKAAALSADEKHIAYVSIKNGYPQIFVKHIETGKERILFENSKQEFALTKPVWHWSGKRIASSVNNKPFIIELESNRFSIKWLNMIIGEPIVWYNKSDAILYVDKKTHNDELVKFNLTTDERTTLKIKRVHDTFFLNHKDELLSFVKGQVIRHDSDNTLLKSPYLFTQIYPEKNGFYYQYTQNGKPLINYYDYELGVQNLSSKTEEFCAKFCDQITAVSDNIILLKSKHKSADILVLDITSKSTKVRGSL
ncbi:winged helix-turn-helix domain-containing protein [Pseudoalteromonas sp. S558]|uniref:winged helix-turn-helix domain-containing protein n=1 Tax=Pseudoalteromonas sp. S558 TaxID=2066515 RepID=UPI00110BD3B4|nr:winged helix-turn-helix domain-containing protein [Pseudoalteromonas sp. S558]TMN93765.1 hypothetical protein CWB66_21010 [Pseudoalteromonas sp. S558]